MDKISYILLFFIFYAPMMNAQSGNSDPLETIASFGTHMAIGVSVNTANRLFVSFPGSDGDGHLAVAEVKNGKLSAYPDEEWNKKGDYDSHFLRVQDLYVDAEDMLWILDSKPTAKGNIFGDGKGDASGQFKLVGINTKNNKVEKVYLVDDLDKENSALNDVRVDTKKQMAYLSDPGLAAIVVLDLKTGKTRTLLRKTSFTLADEIVPTYDGKEMKDKNGKPFSSNINGIALTHDFKYFYFKPINKKELFRIETKFLVDTSLSAQELESKVETAGMPGITHGLIADKRGNIYLTTSENYSISYLTPEGKLHTLIENKELIWPDSFGIGTDGYLYFSCAQIQRLPQWNDGVDKTEYPYRVYRVRLP